MPRTVRCYAGVLSQWQSSGMAPEAYARGLGERYKRSTVALHLSVLRQHYRDAMERGELASNPFASIKPPRPDCSRADSVLSKSLSPTDTKRLFDYITSDSPGPRDSALLGTMLFAGLRVSETAALTWDKIRGSEMEILGKGFKIRVIPITALLSNLLAAVPDKSRARVFGLSKRGVQECVNRHLKKLGLKRPGLSAHGLRHSSAQAMIIGGATINQVRAILGHTSVSTTMVYVESAARHMKNPMLNLENLMRGESPVASLDFK